MSYPAVVQALCGRGGALLLQLSLVFRCAGLMIVRAFFPRAGCASALASPLPPTHATLLPRSLNATGVHYHHSRRPSRPRGRPRPALRPLWRRRRRRLVRQPRRRGSGGGGALHGTSGHPPAARLDSCHLLDWPGGCGHPGERHRGAGGRGGGAGPGLSSPAAARLGGLQRRHRAGGGRVAVAVAVERCWRAAAAGLQAEHRGVPLNRASFLLPSWCVSLPTHRCSHSWWRSSPFWQRPTPAR